jgi:CRISPR/Cas system type I-B associated protein Csh2 (Cas7 group RAMP superfamily)
LKKGHDTSSNGFALDYEPRIIISDIALKPKVQKYHTETEFGELIRHGYKHVETFLTAKNGLVQAVGSKAREIGADELRAAIEFEFNVPHPEGRRLGMVDEAKAAFSKRLGMKL